MWYLWVVTLGFKLHVEVSVGNRMWLCADKKIDVGIKATGIN